MATAASPPSSALSQIMSATTNATAHLNPFPADFAMAIPRFLSAAGSFAFVTVPERIDSILHGGGSVIAEATGNGSRQILSAALSRSGTAAAAAAAQQSATTAGPAAAAVAAATAEASDGAPGLLGIFTIQQVRNMGGIFMYATSKWALACFALAIILNRTQIYASARRHLVLTWPVRLLLRIGPVCLFLSHILSLLQAIRCQTSPYYSLMKYGNEVEHHHLDFSEDGGLLYWLSSKILFMESEMQSCRAVKMAGSTSGESWEAVGSLSLLWPLFQALCFGQFVETLSCAVQGRQLMTETGMSIFEHSLAFAEAEGMLSSILGLSPFSIAKGRPQVQTDTDSAYVVTTKRALFRKLNTPPENLLMGLISSMNHLSSHILGIFDMQARYRLLNTGVWGVCFMSAFIWGFFSLRPESDSSQIILRFPTVCIVGFIPHLLILVGILICTVIYLLALVLCFISPPDDVARLPLPDRLKWARENMQANAQLSNIRLNMHEDFYTALLKVGFSALTVASEAVYLNEYPKVGVAQYTWLEEDRLKQIEKLDWHDGAAASSILSDMSRTDRVGKTGQAWKSGYAKFHTLTVGRASRTTPGPRTAADGVGHLQRGNRYFLVYRFFESIFWLSAFCMRLVVGKALDQLGISKRPFWLKEQRRKEGLEESVHTDFQVEQLDFLDFWILSEDGTLTLAEDDDIDVEQETRRRAGLTNGTMQATNEDQLSKNLYQWWKRGGWWGERDESGVYQPPDTNGDEDYDTTSVVSLSTAASEIDDDSDKDDWSTSRSGCDTPTQGHFARRRNRSISPPTTSDMTIDPIHLASLLDPKSETTRSEARMLAHHLSSPQITTRSRFRQAQVFANAKVLTSTRFRPTDSTTIPPTGPLTPSQEAQLLEQIIISKRTTSFTRANPPSAHNLDNPDANMTDFGSNGPQCVVCQSSPRSILAWPCRCLSLCEECRVSLAMNNFATCVCCRQDVSGFSRLYVP